ncbi:MAG: hypothetical protein HYV16_02940 [Gammaproteobacteria bacterium]|nr:hypothetical protein [Gammaproteobacteria bacterium]
MTRIAELTVRVHLDEEARPQRIEWSGTDAGFPGWRSCEAVNLTLWDAPGQRLCGLGLWAENTPLADMQAYLCQSLAQLADLGRRAICDEALAALIDDCRARLAAHVACRGAASG